MKSKTTYGLKPQALARLLRIGLAGRHAENDPPPAPSAQQVLRDFLDKKPSFAPEMAEIASEIRKQQSDHLDFTTQQNLGELLLDPRTDAGVLRAMKAYGKRLVRSDDSENVHAAATVIYYAAIASAFVFYGEKISRHPDAKLSEACLQIEQKPWLPDELKALFRKARTLCQQGGSQDE